MRPLIYIASFLAVLVAAFWAYRENYATQELLKNVSGLNRQIANLRATLDIQKAEWAYQNRPERLQQLVNANFDRLQLLPFQAEQFGTPQQVTYPPEPLFGLTIDPNAAQDELIP
ncbi:cell division protein FtsL [Falsirhodobacter halotolerans]|uniref:cell division protein FtsL n=1 Tax=Falsirhodobacter halotolerans TaxID=1146892 RepID=UPI001FD35F5C|nr:cell division protein FtsL [Falsirhodobacter halotolerans]MCJ8140312.1 cell division protein FtsL [Falsirhodobacter halotolerans]